MLFKGKFEIEKCTSVSFPPHTVAVSKFVSEYFMGCVCSKQSSTSPLLSPSHLSHFLSSLSPPHPSHISPSYLSHLLSSLAPPVTPHLFIFPHPPLSPVTLLSPSSHPLVPLSSLSSSHFSSSSHLSFPSREESHFPRGLKSDGFLPALKQRVREPRPTFNF